MKRTKHLASAIALALFVGVFWSAQAQVSNTKATRIQGIEVAPGIEDSERGVINGTSFLGKTSGTFPGSFFMSLNYEKTSLYQPVPAVNNIQAGAWSLPIYRSNMYLGAIYGRVVDGRMEWNDDNTIAKVTIELSIDGGTQTFAEANGKGVFVGTLNRSTRGKPTMSGSLMFDF